MTTVDAFAATSEQLDSIDDPGPLTALPASVQDSAARHRHIVRRLVLPAQLLASTVAGAVVAAAMSAPPVLVAGVLTAWLVAVHVEGGRSAHRGLPRVPAVARASVLTFTLVAAAATLPSIPDAVLAQSLAILAATTAVLAVALVAASRTHPPMRVLVVGDPAEVGETVTGWAQRRDLTVVGGLLMRPDPEDPVPALETFGVPMVEDIEELDEVVRELDVDSVVVLPGPAVGPTAIRRLSWILERSRAVLVVRTVLDTVAPHRVHLSRLAGTTCAQLRPSRPSGAVRLLKGLFDRVAAALLLVLFFPLLSIILLAVRLDSPGPAVFRQTRTGLNGRPFTMYKVRTMRTDAEELRLRLLGADEGNGVLFKIRQDPRVTRIGRLLRITSLDELPQLVNVVRGQMSLVGPRPALPEEVALYDETALRRLSVRPGLTGLWQVSGRSDLSWEESIALDLHYADNISLRGDLGICLETVRAVTARRGAY